MKNKNIFLMVLLFYSPVSFSSQEATWDHMGGYVFGVNKVNFDVPSDVAVNVNFVAFFPSVGVEYIHGSNSLSNVFFGLGFSNLIQVQVGTGSEGFVKKIRSDLFLSSLFTSRKSTFSFPLMYPKRKNARWFDKLALSLSVTDYNHKIGTIYQVGIGVTN